jgi:Killing trait
MISSSVQWFKRRIKQGSEMAFPTAVNDQITDSVTQANVEALGEAPAIAMGNLYQATAQALANAAHNATNAQQQSYVTAQAATTMGVATLFSIDTAATGIATEDILKS